MTDNNRYHVFSSNSQADLWLSVNCDRCALSNIHRSRDVCDIEQILTITYWYEDVVTPEIARRMGYWKPDGTINMSFVWPCPEAQYIEE